MDVEDEEVYDKVKRRRMKRKVRNGSNELLVGMTSSEHSHCFIPINMVIT